MSGLISLREAAIISGYHQDYLSFLIRKNKLHGEKIGRAWCIKEQELKEFLLRRGVVENEGGEKPTEFKKNFSFLNIKTKQILFVLFFLFVSLVVFFEYENDIKIINAAVKKSGHVVNTVYSDTTSEISSETSTKN